MDLNTIKDYKYFTIRDLSIYLYKKNNLIEIYWNFINIDKEI